jgi:hypothetical protein
MSYIINSLAVLSFYFSNRISSLHYNIFYCEAVLARFKIFKSYNIKKRKKISNLKYKQFPVRAVSKKTFILNNNSFSWLEIFAKSVFLEWEYFV